MQSPLCVGGGCPFTPLPSCPKKGHDGHSLADRVCTAHSPGAGVPVTTQSSSTICMLAGLDCAAHDSLQLACDVSLLQPVPASGILPCDLDSVRMYWRGPAQLMRSPVRLTLCCLQVQTAIAEVAATLQATSARLDGLEHMRIPQVRAPYRLCWPLLCYLCMHSSMQSTASSLFSSGRQMGYAPQMLQAGLIGS